MCFSEDITAGRILGLTVIVHFGCKPERYVNFVILLLCGDGTGYEKFSEIERKCMIGCDLSLCVQNNARSYSNLKRSLILQELSHPSSEK